jgi:SNF family Na+-dependent transporter
LAGISLTGRVVYLTASLPCLLLVAFLVRGLTLPGASQGLIFFLQPDWARVLEPRIWVNAASQVL